MIRFTKKIAALVILFSMGNVARADRGIGKKTKRTNLNINTPTTLRNSISLNIKSGLTYKGSLLSSTENTRTSFMTSIVTYQKGNTVYIIPYKHKIAMPDIHPGYAGIKFVFHPHK
jgi:hypothetical protein